MNNQNELTEMSGEYGDSAPITPYASSSEEYVTLRDVDDYEDDSYVGHKRWYAPPALVFIMLILCFPVGILLMLFFTKWGAFPKILLICFTLIMWLTTYEVLVGYNVIDTPSLIVSAFDSDGSFSRIDEAELSQSDIDYTSQSDSTASSRN